MGVVMGYTGFVSVLLLRVLTTLPSNVVEARHVFAVQESVMAADASESLSIWPTSPTSNSVAATTRGGQIRASTIPPGSSGAPAICRAQTGIYWARSTIRPTGPDVRGKRGNARSFIGGFSAVAAEGTERAGWHRHQELEELLDRRVGGLTGGSLDPVLRDRILAESRPL
jgi:hypothetical protein